MSPVSPTKDQTMVALLGEVISQPIRVQILQLVNQETLTTGEIAAKLDIRPSVSSHHVQMLQRAGLVVTSRSGRYSLVGGLGPDKIIECVNRVLERKHPSDNTK